jgi:hypothetical protein
MRGLFYLAASVALTFGAPAALAAAPVAGASAVTGVASATPVLRYTFDHGGLADESGHGHTLVARAVRGGTAHAVAHGDGQALRFPPHCSGSGKKCPKVVLQTASTEELNPGTAPFRYGATVLLPKEETTRGQNVLQKGYSSAGGQYKLQIDGKGGRPSCVLVGTGRHVIHTARSSVSVADGSWHSIECQRSGALLTVVVDGVARGTAPVPATLSVANAAPLSVGGKGAYTDNDQFQGTLDDVWVARS